MINQGKITPGPWVWFQENKGWIYLGTPDRTRLTVMDFVRCGMRDAQPRFAFWDGPERGRMGGLMKKGETFDVASHPDARLISLAPDHAEIAHVLCTGLARWERETSEFCIGGIRYSTTLDEFGIPVMTQGMRAAIYIVCPNCGHMHEV